MRSCFPWKISILILLCFGAVLADSNINRNQDSIKILEELCQLPFLSCKKNKKGAVSSEEGSFGVGAYVKIYNNGLLPIEVYVGCPTAKLTRSCYLSPARNATVHGFIKVEQDIAAIQNEDSYDNEQSSLSKEIDRARTLSVQYTFPKTTVSMVPYLIEIFDKTTNTRHSLHQSAYIQESIRGMTAYDISLQLQQMEKKSMAENVERVITRLSDITTAKQKGAEKIVVRRAEARAISTIKRAQMEMWLRARLRLHLAYVMLETIQILWSMGVLHCDAHWNNIMLIQDKITNEAEFLDILKSGRGFIPHLPLFYSETSVVPSTFPSWIKDKKYISVYYFYPTFIRFIDVANALTIANTLNSRLTEMKQPPAKFPLARHPAPAMAIAESQIFHPCKAFRPWRREDIIDFYISLGGLFEFADPLFTFNTIGKKLHSQYTKSFDTWNRQALHFLQLSNVNETTLKQSRGAKAISILRGEAKSISLLYRRASVQMQSSKSYKDCNSTAATWHKMSRDIRRSVTQSNTPDMDAQRLLKTSCSFRNMRESAVYMQAALNEIAPIFPAAARPQFNLIVL